MGEHVFWFDLAIPVEEFAREIAPGVRDQLQRDIVTAERRMFRLLQLEETRPQIASQLRARIELLRESIQAMEEGVAHYSRLIRQHTTSGPLMQGSSTVANPGALRPPSSTVVTQAASSVSDGRLARLLQAGRAAGSSAWQSIRSGWQWFAGGLGAAWTAVRSLGIRGVILTVVRGLPGGPAGVVLSLVTVAVAGGGYYYFYVAETPAAAGFGDGEYEVLIIDPVFSTVQLIVGFGSADTLTLDPDVEILAGPGDHAAVNRELCDKLDAGSLNQASETTWSARFQGRLVVLTALDVERLRDCPR